MWITKSTNQKLEIIAIFLGKISFHFTGTALLEQLTDIANYSILVVKRVLYFEY
jgi:hypothetical protein